MQSEPLPGVAAMDAHSRILPRWVASARSYPARTAAAAKQTGS